MAINFNALLVGGATGWHTGNRNVTYSFISRVPNYYPAIDTDGNGSNDSRGILMVGPGNPDEVVDPAANVALDAAHQALAIRVVQAFNEVARTNVVPQGAGGGGGTGTPVTGNGTLMGGLGGATGYGENLVDRGDDNSTPAVGIDTVFANGLNFFGHTYHSLFVNNNGSVSFGNAVGAYTPTTITGGGTPLIAPFWADVDTRLDTSAPIAPAGPQVVYDLDTAHHVFTATWPGVDYFNVGADSHAPKGDFFQLQLYDRGGGGAGTGNDFDIVFRYQSLQWTTGDASGGSSGLGGTPAHGGWTAGNGTNFEEVPGSGNQNSMLALPGTPGNTGVQGMWVYQVRNGQVAVGDITFAGYHAFSANVDSDGSGIAGRPPGVNGAPVLPSYPTAVADTQLLAFAHLPDHPVIGTPSEDGDVWFNLSNPEVANAELGSHGFRNILHEFGHAMGLHHPNEDPNNTANDPHNNNQYTIMSYVPHPYGGQADWDITPMVLDIQALQQLYGANTTTRSGNTTYFGPAVAGSTQAYAMLNGGLIAESPGHHMIMTIWDGGGIDTISAANQTGSVTIDLEPGAFSTIGQVTDNICNAELWTDPGTGIQYGWLENAVGGPVSDLIFGNDIANDIDGGAGPDSMVGRGGNDTYHVDDASDSIVENIGDGTDQVFSSVSYALSSNVENLTLIGANPINGTGNILNNIIVGNAAANVIDGRGGADGMIGGAGDDSYIVDDAGDAVVESANEGTDTVYSAINDRLAANLENLILQGIAGLQGYGNNLGNSIYGNTGNNLLDGDTGADAMFGGLGDDSYFVDNAGDAAVENANEGTDTVYSSINYRLSPNLENLILLGAADLQGYGNTVANTIVGNPGSNLLDGGAGVDTMYGGAGNDTYFVDQTFDRCVENPASGVDSVFTSVNYTLGANVENLFLGGNAIVGTGNGSANYIAGNAFNNVIDGSLGPDTMVGGGGDDLYVVDDAGDQVVEAVNEGTNDTVYSSTHYRLPANVEILVLQGGADLQGYGNTLANTVYGNTGNNIVDGGTGADTMLGGLGNDVYFVDNSGDGVVENANEGTDAVFSTVHFRLGANVENLLLQGGADLQGYGNTLANVINGNSGNNIIDGGPGADIMAGGAGNDAYFVDNIADAVVENANAGNDTVYSTAHFRLGVNVENLILQGSADLQGYGNTLANTIYGNAGSNVIDGGAGADAMLGGAGNDAYFVDNVADAAVENANEGTDTVYSSAHFRLGANVENLILQGSADLQGYGNTLGNTIYGNSGSNVIDGGASADNMLAGLGNDVYFVDNIGDAVVENANEGNDTVYSTVHFRLGANVENLILQGSADLQGYGNTLANTIYGNSGSNVIDGGLGADAMLGAAGNDAYFVDNAGDAVVENANEGSDTVYSTAHFRLGANVENLVLQGSADLQGYGNTLANAIYGNSGNNIIDGGVGADTLTGNGGNDTFLFHAGEANGDFLTDFAGNGAAAGDSLLFIGYGSGATFSAVDATHWQVNYGGGASHDLITFAGAASLHASDYAFI
jgi:Ca2+-binding RTX toxin-like protein